MIKIKIGLGKRDVTGPCARVGFLGMSNIRQRGRGTHTRLYSRAFVVKDQKNGKSVAFVCADIGACTHAVKQAVIKKLKAGMVMPDYELRSLGLGFGEFDEQPKTSYRKGEAVMFSFVGGYPNRDLKTGGSYYKVERAKPDGSWELKYTDDDFCTQMRRFMMEHSSMIRIEWKIPETQESGTYRIVYDGPFKRETGGRVEPLPVVVKFTIK